MLANFYITKFIKCCFAFSSIQSLNFVSVFSVTVSEYSKFDELKRPGLDNARKSSKTILVFGHTHWPFQSPDIINLGS
jgi:hypothetical protein